jgi:hypothetical protein
MRRSARFTLLTVHLAASARPTESTEETGSGERAVDQGLHEWPQRDLNPCYRLERADCDDADSSHEC